MKQLLAAALLTLMLGACVSVSKVEGDRVVGERLNLHLTGAWNHINAPGLGPAQTWTMEGIHVDQLLVYSGLKSSEAIHAQPHGGPGSKAKVFTFRADMQPDEIAALFEGMLTRDGSSYKLAKLEPATFGGQKGFRFEYALIRKLDNVQLSGVGYGAVSRGELFALVYMAPRLGFFARHAPAVNAIASSARIRE